MRFLFLSAQLPGHLDWGGFLLTAAELVRRGHTVLWASGDEVRAQVETAQVAFHRLVDTGWRWPPPPPLAEDASPNAQESLRLRQERALDQWLDENRVARAADEIVELASSFRPHVIVGEMFVAAGGLAADMLSTPFVVAGWPAASGHTDASPLADEHPPQSDIVCVARGRLQRLLQRFNIGGVNWTRSGPPALLSPRLHLTYWSPSWFVGVQLGPQTRHVGGVRRAPQSPDPDLPSPEESPWVLITLGTSFNQDANFFLAAAHAADELGCLPILAVGAPGEATWVRDMRTRLPASAIVRERVDFDCVLPYAAAAIHHGGAGTTHALITNALPQIVVPHAADQARQALGITRSGVGLHLPAKQVTIPRLVAALAHVLPDLSPCRAAAQTLQGEFAALGGVPTAANLLLCC